MPQPNTLSYRLYLRLKRTLGHDGLCDYLALHAPSNVQLVNNASYWRITWTTGRSIEVSNSQKLRILLCA